MDTRGSVSTGKDGLSVKLNTYFYSQSQSTNKGSSTLLFVSKAPVLQSRYNLTENTCYAAVSTDNDVQIQI